MFRAIILALMSAFPFFYNIFLKSSFTFLVFVLVTMGMLVFFLLISWISSQRASNYNSVKIALRDILSDITAIVFTSSFCWIWYFKSTDFFSLNETEFITIQVYYVLLMLICIIESYMTVNNSLLAMRKLVMSDDD